VSQPFVIAKLPSLLEYYSFVFCFFNFLVGPVPELQDYLKFTNLTAFKDDKLKGRIPSNYTVVAQRVLETVFCFALFMGFNSYVPFSWISTPQFASKSIIFKYLYVTVGMMGIRLQYYFVWKLAEGSNLAAGFGFNGYDAKGKAKWDKIDNINALAIEVSQSPRDIAMNWNIRIAAWLRTYVYLRVGPVNKRPSDFALHLTNAASAVWHGVYLGYWASFLFLSFVVDIARKVRRTFRPLVVNVKDGKEVAIQPWKQLYDICGIVVTQVSIAYTLTPLNLVHNNGTWQFLIDMNFSGQLLVVFLYIMFFVIQLLPKHR